MVRYANKTKVPVDRSRTEIEATLKRYGASGFLYGWQNVPGDHKAVIGFEVDGRNVRFLLPLPERTEFLTSPVTGFDRTERSVDEYWEQAKRQRWRALALGIKAKLEMVETGITEFDEEFLAHIVLATGQTVGEWAGPQLEKLSGKSPGLLPTGA